MRLPGSVAEIASSPAGPAVGAFFDLDGTLIAGYSARHLAEQRLRDRDIGVNELVRSLGFAAEAGLGRAGFDDLLTVGAQAWRGRSHDDLEEMGERLFHNKIERLVFPEMRALVRAHQARGHTVVLSSSATAYQAEPVARFLGIDDVLCNRFSVVDGLLTGEVDKPVLWGPGKAAAVQTFARARGVKLAESYFYADGDEDLALMYLVGNPRPTNPGKRLAGVAGARGWPVLRFGSRESSSTGAILRSVASMAALGPLGSVGLAVGLATRDKWQGLNFVAPRFLDAMFALNRVKLEVAGREHLWAARPAVFTFNHRNNFDAFMAARLVERDFTAVAKKELQNSPLLGLFGRVADMAFIDRASPRAAVEALKPIEDLARAGRSIIIAPEGTRIDTTGVGPFKKGAFRMAMSVGMPVVPIVIHDAEFVAARDASGLSPGTVHITVLPPVPVGDWTPRNVNGHIAEIRQQYLDTLECGFQPDA